MSDERATVVCGTCGFPAQVIFDDEGEIKKVLQFCGHLRDPTKEESSPASDDKPSSLQSK